MLTIPETPKQLSRINWSCVLQLICLLVFHINAIFPHSLFVICIDRLVLLVYFDRLEISIEIIYFKKAGKDIPMLSVIDDGHGMTHDEVVRMTYFGHKQPDADNPDRIGRFGVGFKVDLLDFSLSECHSKCLLVWMLHHYLMNLWWCK